MSRSDPYAKVSTEPRSTLPDWYVAKIAALPLHIRERAFPGSMNRQLASALFATGLYPDSAWRYWRDRFDLDKKKRERSASPPGDAQQIKSRRLDSDTQHSKASVTDTQDMNSSEMPLGNREESRVAGQEVSAHSVEPQFPSHHSLPALKTDPALRGGTTDKKPIQISPTASLSSLKDSEALKMACGVAKGFSNATQIASADHRTNPIHKEAPLLRVDDEDMLPNVPVFLKRTLSQPKKMEPSKKPRLHSDVPVRIKQEEDVGVREETLANVPLKKQDDLRGIQRNLQNHADIVAPVKVEYGEGGNISSFEQEEENSVQATSKETISTVVKMEDE
ncbi:hypothetical protein DM02DRAFT_657833 [Periconia macrospinosa]|uniref:Uncharacterized protein n=1 Tax=Periconia macrospinosa TaxID=97972 RepID=A0A2V1DJA3_9PLEO|nr:hypothetical protein DM02DRAFT_657833 [Periconia macrospinosa]